MEAQETSLKPIDEEKIRTAVHLHTPIEITTYTLPHNMELYIQEVLSVFLSECHQEHMTEYLKFCLSELLTNSKKANTKRIYFREQHLNLNDELDYHTGMVSFKDDTLENIKYYLEEQKKAGLYVKLILQVNDDYINLEIRNNSVLTIFETKRINEKMKTAQKYSNVDEVMSRVIDQTEGAGLGIIIIILMLQKIGLKKENYKVFSTDTETITRIILPLNEEYNSKLELLCNNYIDKQEKIPVLSENFEQLVSMLKKGDSKEELMDFISKDPTLALLLLKKASEKDANCSSLKKAYDLVDVKEFNEIFSPENPLIRMITKKQDDKNLWEHSYRVALYSYNIAQNLSASKIDSLDEVYTYGLLHDIECILRETVENEQKADLDEMIQKLEIPESVVKMFYNDNGHNKAGSRYIKAMGLSERLSDLVKYHNEPAHALDELKQIVQVVYLADILQYYRNNLVEYYQIDKDVLKALEIDAESRLEYIISQVESVL